MDMIAVATLVSSTVTAVAAIYVAFIALQQTARPRIDVRMTGDFTLPAATESKFVFEVINVGHWYAAPAAAGINVYPNFDPEFKLRECRYGSVQEQVNTHVRIGKGGLTYVRAKHIGLSAKNEMEEFHVIGTTPDKAGRYRILVSATSENGASCQREFWIEIIPARHPATHARPKHISAALLVPPRVGASRRLRRREVGDGNS